MMPATNTQPSVPSPLGQSRAADGTEGTGTGRRRRRMVWPESSHAWYSAWMMITKVLTFWVPEFLLKKNYPLPEARIAWREKVAVCVILLIIAVVGLFIVLYIPVFWCTDPNIYTPEMLIAPASRAKAQYLRALYPPATGCIVYSWIILGLTLISAVVLIVIVIAAAYTQFRSYPADDKIQKGVILHVPCYSETKEVLQKTLLFLVMDGLIVGKNQKMTTPDILLHDVLYWEGDEPEPVTYPSTGHGDLRMNGAQVYSGWHETENCSVPYIVVVKVGLHDTDLSRLGNRSKRDSQLIIMKFLRSVNFWPNRRDKWSALDLELERHYLQLGLDPADYEYFLLTDADTFVLPDGLSRQITLLEKNQNILGTTGETAVENKWESITAAAQVYEYFITHRFLKSFESLLGEILVLSGCFAVYRIKQKNPSTGVWEPRLCDDFIIAMYNGSNPYTGEPFEMTMHRCNLYKIGEDRFLSTLLLRKFHTMHTEFIPKALCITAVPTSLPILLNQRRRWTNSLLHNHIEVMAYDPRSGIRGLLLRFVVLVELGVCLITPVLTIQFLFLVFCAVVEAGLYVLPMVTSFVLLSVGLVITIATLHFEQLFWYIPFVLCFPIFSIVIPIWSCWRLDDFTWGTTRKTAADAETLSILSSRSSFASRSSLASASRSSLNASSAALSRRASSTNVALANNQSLPNMISRASSFSSSSSARGGSGNGLSNSWSATNLSSLSNQQQQAGRSPPSSPLSTPQMTQQSQPATPNWMFQNPSSANNAPRDSIVPPVPSHLRLSPRLSYAHHQSMTDLRSSDPRAFMHRTASETDLEGLNNNTNTPTAPSPSQSVPHRPT
ncbi:chitin synthase-domain-containing protein [Phlyctochytrium arcticum]|nr:chitin synthase-domain-containing protein [Phlyctochytrium arcticum]